MPDFRADVARRLGGLDIAPAEHAEIVEELSQHLADCYETARSRGASDADAHRQALDELSGEAMLERALAGLVPKAQPGAPPIGKPRGGRLFGSLWLDLKHALRSLLKSPGYTGIVLVVLALGLGASTAIFAVVEASMLRRLPYAEPDRLVRIWESNAERGWPQFSASAPNFLDFRERARSFEHLAAIASRRHTLTQDGNAEMLEVRAVSRDFLPALRVLPLLGREFEAAEDTPGGDNRVVLLMHGFWQRAFGGDPRVLGRSLVLDGAAYRVIGVMPEEFSWGQDTSVLLPLAADPGASRGDHRLSLIGRLAPGATLETARAELDAIAQGLGRSYPDTNGGWSVTVFSFYDWLVPPESRQSLLVLSGAVALLLLIACGNVTNLMLARANGRRRELAVRTALGADRGRIVSYVLVEALALALTAGALGTGLALGAVRALQAFGPDAFPRLDEVAIGPGVLAFVFLVSIATGLLFGSIAAWRATRANVNATLRDSSQGAGTEARRLRSGLVLLEMALSVALLIGAGLLIRSFWKLQSVDPGFPTGSLVTASINLPGQRYGDEASQVQFYERLLETTRALPGVGAAALSSMVPFSDGDTSTEVKVPGWDAPADAGLPSASWRLISPGYFAALGIPLRGRDFDARDNTEATPNTIISESMARTYWPDSDPIGKTVVLGSLSESPVTIIGVAGDVRTFGLDREPGAMVYVSTLAVPGWNPMQLAVRSTLPAETQAAALREALRGIDPNVPMFGVETVDDLLSRSFAERRLNMVLLATFAFVALVLASVGLGGVLAYLVSQRTREIGIRMALGAHAREVFRLVVGQGMRLAFAGAALGVLAALFLARAMQSQLYAVTAGDPLTFALVPAVLLLVALAACWWPAHRAARVDPNTVLRSD